MTVDNLPDVEGALRDWLRANTAITPTFGNRTFFGVPKGATERSFPLITVQRIGGGGEAGQAPTDAALVQIDVWGNIDEKSGNGLKAECTTAVNTVRAQLRSVDHRTALNASVDALSITEVGCVWSPDPDNDRPRYSVTAEVTAISS